MHIFARRGRRSVLMRFARINASSGKVGLVANDAAGLDRILRDAAQAHHRENPRWGAIYESS
jgi:hypothetical protein